MYNIISFWRDNNSSDELNCFCSHANLNKDISDIVKKIKCSDSPKVQLHFIAKILDFFIQQNTNTNNNGRLLLLLEKSLDEQWQNYKWEEITLPYKNETLNKYVLVIRYADLTYYKANNFDNFKHFYNNQLPKDFPRENENFFSTNILSKVNFTDKFSKGQNSIENGELFIFAHGSQNGILDKKCQELDFFNTFPNVPKRIWLIACNEENINTNNNESGVYKIAKKLISDKYCDTVITATTPLNAYCMSAMVQKWFNNNDNNIVDPAVFLSEIQNDNTNGGVFNLTIFGNIYISCDNAQIWNYSYWLAEHKIRFYNKKYILNHATSLKEFQDAYISYSTENLWNNTKDDLEKSLFILSERYDHNIMKYIYGKILNKPGVNAKTYLSLSKHSRRIGKYNACVQNLLKGYKLLNKNITDKSCSKSDLLIALSNIFIDLNLPNTADSFLNLSKITNNDLDNKLEYKSLDIAARIYIRQNDIFTAMDCLETKQESEFSQKDYNGGGKRELALILYALSWYYNTDNYCTEYYKNKLINTKNEVCKILSDTHNENICMGNDSILYLVRALSVWCWKNPYDLEANNILSKWLDFCHANLTRVDIGPIIYILIFSILNQNNDIHSLVKRKVTNLLSLLTRNNYFLEASIFALLNKDNSKISYYLKIFQKQREEAVKLLIDNENICQLLEIKPKNVIEEIKNRIKLEDEVNNLTNISDDNIVSIIINNGIIPS